ncbi:hypothetical protein K458DRAFT_424207, partial [Lentithecium fluviatile CBS 122367]
MDATTHPPRDNYADIPTPPASSIAPTVHPNPLPQHRKHPLKPGGPKESELIHYLDQSIGKVQVRVHNRVNHKKSPVIGDDGRGFRTFAEAAKELEGLVDVIWVSGSPNLQIPYLLHIAAIVIDSLPLFKPAPKATLRLLDKLDFAFSSLLQTRDPDTDLPLPGFETGRTVSTTDKVRLKGIVEHTRLVVVKKLGGREGETDGEGEEVDAEVDEDVNMDGEEVGEDGGMVSFEGFEGNNTDGMDGEGDVGGEERRVAKVYEKTLGELGELLGGEPIGIITD